MIASRVKAIRADRRRLADLDGPRKTGRSWRRLRARAAAKEHRPLLRHHDFAVLVHQLEPRFDDADLGPRARDASAHASCGGRAGGRPAAPASASRSHPSPASPDRRRRTDIASQMMRIIIEAVCQPEAIRPPATEARRRFLAEMEGLRIELPREGDDLFRRDFAIAEFDDFAERENPRNRASASASSQLAKRKCSTSPSRDDVVLAFEAELARFARARLALVGDIVIVGDRLGADEAFFEVGVDDAGRLRRRARPSRPSRRAPPSARR